MFTGQMSQDETISRNEGRCSFWFRKLQTSQPVPIQKTVRLLAALCALGVFGGVTISVWFVVQMLLTPASNTLKESLFCNKSDDSVVADSRKDHFYPQCWPVLRKVLTEKGSVFYRISAENSLLEIQLEKLQTWLPVCYERWNSSLGTLVCQQLGHLRLTKHKGVNLTDAGHRYTDGFVQITSEHQGKLEHLWQLRGNCSTGKIIALKCDCGTRVKVPRMIDGVNATLGRWPWQVSLYYNNHHTCEGSIIANQWIVTAAHCVSTLHHISSWVVYAGVVTPNAAKLPRYMGYTVEQIIYNKNYNYKSRDSDIALIKLRNPLNLSDTVRPVCLPQYYYELPAGTLCWISGRGYTQPDEVHIPGTLKETQVSLISTEKCNSSCMYNGEITPRMLCAGDTEGNADVCQKNDSGSPLVCQDDNVWRLVGVMSWGAGCAEPNHPGVYTKVAEFLGWIYEIIEVCCSNMERS